MLHLRTQDFEELNKFSVPWSFNTILGAQQEDEEPWKE